MSYISSFNSIDVIASALLTTSDTVNVSNSVAPTTGQVLKATSGTTATWQTLPVYGDVSGAGSSTDDTLVIWDGITGTLLKDGVARPTGAIVGTTDSQVLTNKTLTSTTNTITAKSLHSATTVIDVVSATAPTTGQVLTATSSTTATWQSPSGGSGALVLIQSQTASTSANIDFTGITSTYNNYVIEFTDIKLVNAGAVLSIRTSTDGGSTFSSTANDYYYAYQSVNTSGSGTNVGSTTATEIRLGAGTSTVSSDSTCGRIFLYSPLITASYTMFSYNCCTTNNSGYISYIGGGQRHSVGDVDAIRFLANSGNISSGTFSLYGVAK